MTKEKTAKKDYKSFKVAVADNGSRRSFVRADWRPMKGEKGEFQGIQVFAPADPYSNKERKEFRTAITNPYVFRASRIQTGFTVGQGYTTEIVPRTEEDIPAEQLQQIKKTSTVKIPYWDDKEFTYEQLLDWIDKKAKELDLATNISNAYMMAIEQGRCVLAMTPLDKDDDGFYQLPQQLRLIRTELTDRPVLDEDTGELVGVRIIGVRSDAIKDSVLPADRMIYVLHGFNNELFADYFGDSRVARISDEANTLNIVLNQDFERVAEYTWFKPPIFQVPIPPQEYGNEDSVLTSFANNINDNKGQALAVTGPSNPEETGVVPIFPPSNADVGGLEVIRIGLIKAIITAYGIPGFMLSEGDIGKLGGNANIEEVDAYLNQEIRPEKLVIESTLEKQFYDSILKILWKTNDASQIPVKIKIKFNKPKLLTLLTPDMFNVLTGLVQLNLIDESGLRDVLGLEELDKETLTQGAEGGSQPGNNRANWLGWKPLPVPNVNINNWYPNKQNGWNQQTGWNARPKQKGWNTPIKPGWSS